MESKNTEEIIITFGDGTKKDILSFFDKMVDEDGFIIEANSKEKVLSPDGQEVKIDEFAGIMGGSEIFIKSDLISIIELADKIK